MKTILLTGGTGFLGSHIIENLSQKYYIIVLKRSSSDISKIENFSGGIEFFDIDSMNLESLFQTRHIDIIIHTATQYGRNYRNLSDIIEANIYLPMRLIDMGIRYDVSVFLNTDTFWDEHMDLPIGLKYYALSKKDFLQYAHIAIQDAQTMKFINLKIEHLYGPRDDEKKFLPYVISAFFSSSPYLDLTPGEQKRDFIYVKDAVSAYDRILDNIENTSSLIEDYDIGTGEVYSIREVVEKIKVMLSSDMDLRFGALEYRKGEVMEAKADISNLSAVGWTPKFSLESGLQQTISSMKKIQ